MEKFVSSGLSYYMDKQGLFSDKQHAYRKGRNCTMAMLQLQDWILKDASQGQDTSVILTDMSCAFDTISHDAMLGKLKLYGADDEAINWFRNYFSERAQYTQIGATKSMIIRIIWGVFQGSILGRVCFIIFMNDVVILEVDSCIIIIYALRGLRILKRFTNQQKLKELGYGIAISKVVFSDFLFRATLRTKY